MSVDCPSSADPGTGASASVVPPNLATLLHLQHLSEGVFIGYCNGQPGRTTRVFGGALVAQSLLAATQTVSSDRGVHSLHAYFLRAANPAEAIQYRVETLRNGGSFTTRRVTAMQYGEDIFTMTVSFHVPEDGFAHQLPQLAAPPPTRLPAGWPATNESTRVWLERISRGHPFELRIHGELARMATMRGERVAPRQGFWFRARNPLPDEPHLHNSAIAYASDILLLSSSLGPHKTVLNAPEIQFASLDHAMWFHASARADDWLYYEQKSTWAGGARAFCTGRIFNSAGRLVASVAQEGLIRRIPTPTVEPG